MCFLPQFFFLSQCIHEVGFEATWSLLHNYQVEVAVDLDYQVEDRQVHGWGGQKGRMGLGAGQG